MLGAAIPIELFELVIDFIHDENTLQSTCLVCKAWLPRSRFNLFQVVDLCVPEHLDYFAKLLSSAPHIAPFIKELSISDNSLLSLFRPAMSIIARLPLSELAAHPRFQPRRLTVHNQLWLPTRYSPDYFLGLSQFSSVTSLDLFDVTFTTVADFSIVLRALGNLTSLSASHLDCQRQLDAETSASIGCGLPFLTSIRLSSYYPTSAIDWFLRYNSFPSVQHFDISYELSTNDAGQGLGVFWTSVGATLENVSISISKRAAGARLPTAVIETQLDMSRCVALRTLYFDCRHEREVTPNWTWLIWLLSHLTCRSLRCIVFSFQHSSHALACLHSFAAELDRVLSEAPFSRTLDSVVFEFDYRSPAEEDEDEEALLSKFSVLQAKRLLRVA